ncbi:DNA-binding protein [Synergistales bacterium]|nr:DNA-binding protein [Synergistales bacterium]
MRERRETVDTNEDRSYYWIEIAEYDLETAVDMRKTGRYLYVGFMCHQVVEKAFKAMIAKNGVMPPRIHGLVRLAELGGLSDILSGEQKNLINELLPLNIEARYPSQKDKLSKSLNDQYCANLITRTEGLLSWIKEQLLSMLDNTPPK